eukprot:448224_1
MDRQPLRDIGSLRIECANLETKLDQLLSDAENKHKLLVNFQQRDLDLATSRDFLSDLLKISEQNLQSEIELREENIESVLNENADLESIQDDIELREAEIKSAVERADTVRKLARESQTLKSELSRTKKDMKRATKAHSHKLKRLKQNMKTYEKQRSLTFQREELLKAREKLKIKNSEIAKNCSREFTVRRLDTWMSENGHKNLLRSENDNVMTFYRSSTAQIAVSTFLEDSCTLLTERKDTLNKQQLALMSSNSEKFPRTNDEMSEKVLELSPSELYVQEAERTSNSLKSAGTKLKHIQITEVQLNSKLTMMEEGLNQLISDIETNIESSGRSSIGLDFDHLTESRVSLSGDDDRSDSVHSDLLHVRLSQLNERLSMLTATVYHTGHSEVQLSASQPESCSRILVPSPPNTSDGRNSSRSLFARNLL